MKPLSVSLIIPAHNEENFIGECIDSARKYGKFDEIIVVDNASTDHTGEIASQYGARVIREERKGLTHARQVGLEATKSDYLAFIDADCRLSEHWFERLEYYLNKYPNSVSLTGPVRYFDGPLFWRILLPAIQYITLPLAVFFTGYLVIGGNFVARRDAIIRAGGFDRSIEFYGEDADIARRLAKVGYVLLRMDFYNYTSMRRLLHEGVFRTYARYTTNFFSHALFKKSVTKKYVDVRP